MKQRHQRALELHRQKFVAIKEAVGDLTESVPNFIKELPGVWEQLEQANPLAPGNALSGGHGGTSSGGLIGNHAKVQYTFEYYWPDPETRAYTPETTVKVVVSCVVDWEELGHHTILITPNNNHFSRETARYITSILLNDKKYKLDGYPRVEMIDGLDAPSS